MRYIGLNRTRTVFVAGGVPQVELLRRVGSVEELPSRGNYKGHLLPLVLVEKGYSNN